MKAVIVLALCFALAHTQNLSATKTLFCMSVSATTDNNCDGCFNWNNTPKALANNVCTSAFPTSLLVTDCERYATGKSASSTTAGVGDCMRCKSGKVGVATSTSGGVYTNTCISATTTYPKLDPVNCESGYTGYYNTALATATYTPVCGMCKSGKAPAACTNSIYASCPSTTAISNCNRGGCQSTTVACNECKSGYALKSDKSTCIAHSDKNCWQLHTDDTKCKTCYPAYIFDGTVCVKAAKILSAVAIAAAAFFMN